MYCLSQTPDVDMPSAEVPSVSAGVDVEGSIPSVDVDVSAPSASVDLPGEFASAGVGLKLA